MTQGAESGRPLLMIIRCVGAFSGSSSFGRWWIASMLVALLLVVASASSSSASASVSSALCDTRVNATATTAVAERAYSCNVTSSTCEEEEEEQEEQEQEQEGEGEKGWEQPFEIDSEVCTIERRHGLSVGEFRRVYEEQKPVIVVGVSDNSLFKSLASVERLLADYGNYTVILSSSNTFSYEKKESTLAEYIKERMKPQDLKTLANETFYHFGDNDHQAWEPLFDYYVQPPYVPATQQASLSFGLGGWGSGVPLHKHGPVWAEVFHGSKRWFLYPPEHVPKFDPNQSTLRWFHEEYSQQQEGLLECVLRPGELLYLPSDWWHSTLNIGHDVVFMSTFV
ncbi:jmjC domain-containing protein 8 [Balamuthia mandrillaris]